MSAQDKKVLAIVGQGYVGLPLAMAAVGAGWEVIGVDNSASRVEQLNSGSSPIEDITDGQLQAAIASGQYRASQDFAKIARASVVTVCVPTPLNSKREPDVTLLENAVKGIAPHLSNNSLIISESTSYPGTLRNLIIPLIHSLKSAEVSVLHFASAPERVNPGDLNWNQKNTPRLVGAIDLASSIKALEFYASICDSAIAVSTPEVAEAAKLLENTFRLVNIALVNEFAQICSAANINVNEVIDAASSKPYGFMPFRPGVGVGGHCIPVDPLYLTWWARQNHQTATFIEIAAVINNEMPKYVAERALSLVRNSTNAPRVLILGVAYKPGVADVRESPVSDLCRHLQEKGAIVAWHDPLVHEWQGTRSQSIEWPSDVVILATKQPGLEIEALREKGVPILDCTNSFHNLKGVHSI